MSRHGSHLEGQQEEQLAEIGQYLRQTRQDSLLTLEQVNGTTLIRQSLLTAIEDGNLKALPEPVYIRGLIKRYADALGLNGDTLAAQFPVDPTVQPSRPSWRDLPAAQLRPLHLYIAYIVLIMAAISGLSHIMRRSVPPTVAPRMSTQVPIAPTEPAAPDVTQPQPTSPTQSSNSKPVRVEVSVTEPSWLSVVADGETEFEDILSEGSQRIWTADQRITITAGNAGGVIVTYNDGQAEPLGEPGAVAEVTFSVQETTAMVDDGSRPILP
jgi:cytoskeletal protein RodZ